MVSIRKAKKARNMQAQSINPSKNSSHEKEMTLHEAYQIIGGYTNTISPRIFERALEMVRSDDPDFAKAVQALFENGITFKKANNEQLASAEQIMKNAQVIEQEYQDDVQLKKEVFQGKVQELVDNTIVSDISQEDKEEILFRTGQTEVLEEVTEDVDFAQAAPQEKHGILVSRIRDSIKRNLFQARLSSADKPRDAFDFSKKFKVTAKSITDSFKNASKRVTSFINRLSHEGHAKAAAFLNKARTRVHSSMVKLATATIVISSLLPGCCNSGTGRFQSSSEKPNKTVLAQNTDTTSVAQKQNPVSQAPKVTSKAAADSIVVPTEWNDSMGISKGNWKANQTFMNYANAYKKITDDMLQKSGFQTRDQFLDAYRILRSFYPKVIENQGVLSQRSELSDRFSKFFNNDDCIKASDFNAQDFEILKSALQLRGNNNRRALQETQAENDCEPGKVQYTTPASSQKGKKTTVEQTASFQFDEQGQSTVVSDTIPQFTFEETGQSTERVEVKNDTVALSGITVYKGNDIVNGQKIDSIAAQDLLNATVTNKRNILVEQTNVPSSGDTIGTTTGFVETGAARVDTTATQTFSFNEEGASRVDTTKTTPQFSFSETGSSKTVMENENTANTDSVQVVEDSADLPVGTPSAGYVSERGGVNNCGLTEKQLQYSKSKIMATYGKSAYDDLMTGISDEMLSKGNIFEGLTREQAIYNLSVWSVTFPRRSETALIYNYVLNCHQGETMSPEDMAKAKAAMDRIRTNKTIDGVVYNKPVYVKNVKNMGCDEKVQVTSVPLQGGQSPKSPSGPKFSRLFGIRSKREEPIQYSFAEAGQSRVQTEFVEAETQKPIITVHKANDLADSGEKIGEMDITDIKGKVSTRKDVMVENTKANKRHDTQKAKNLAEKKKQARMEALKKYADTSRLALLNDGNSH